MASSSRQTKKQTSEEKRKAKGISYKIVNHAARDARQLLKNIKPPTQLSQERELSTFRQFLSDNFLNEDNAEGLALYRDWAGGMTVDEVLAKGMFI